MKFFKSQLFLDLLCDQRDHVIHRQSVFPANMDNLTRLSPLIQVPRYCCLLFPNGITKLNRPSLRGVHRDT